MQQIMMLEGRRGWFSDEAWWAAGQVVEVAADVADYLVGQLHVAEYVTAAQPEPLTADEPVAETPAAAKPGKRRP